MINVKTAREIELMHEAGKIAAEAMELAREAVRPGVTTLDIDKVIHDFIKKRNSHPTFLGYGGFPNAACISVNEQVIHGIPSSRKVLRNGDIVKIDLGVTKGGYVSDMARTFFAGMPSDEAKKLAEATEASFFEALKLVMPGMRLGDVGNAVESYVAQFGYAVVKKYTGHGVGTELHEEPMIPNYGALGKGVRLISGMTLAIEPMVNAGVSDVRVLSDGWTVITADGKLSAHYENSVAVTGNGPVILTSL